MNRPLLRSRQPLALLVLLLFSALLGACTLVPTDERDAISGAAANESIPLNTARQATPTPAVIPATGGNPAEVAQAFVTAYAALDPTAVASVTCAPRQAQILDLLQGYRSAGSDVSIDVSQLSYTEHSAYDRTAQVDTSGQVTISGGGQQQQGTVGLLLGEKDNPALYLVMELTGWKVCPTR
jgi:hypothetical protein